MADYSCPKCETPLAVPAGIKSPSTKATRCRGCDVVINLGDALRADAEPPRSTDAPQRGDGLRRACGIGASVALAIGLVVGISARNGESTDDDDRAAEEARSPTLVASGSVGVPPPAPTASGPNADATTRPDDECLRCREDVNADDCAKCVADNWEQRRETPERPPSTKPQAPKRADRGRHPDRPDDGQLSLPGDDEPPPGGGDGGDSAPEMECTCEVTESPSGRSYEVPLWECRNEPGYQDCVNRWLLGSRDR